ncbi:Phasin superfamily protein [Giardia muris]|uniref:Phasin superfamily protein n=1 Tax=Giardia muris TaxID=5742 RepID=A0A4Z1T7N0_GIAMU|nr:Phasin superfamily protein [Giardia muris]|eukprot:TNJ28579.1 Phasin superfamily protein [Giardia muris]
MLLISFLISTLVMGLGLKTITFEELQKRTHDLIAVFGDSSVPFGENQGFFDGLPDVYPEVYFIDKADEANKLLFETPELKELPVVYMLSHAELKTERFPGPLSLEAMKEFIAYKTEPLDEAAVDVQTPLATVHASGAPAVVLFTAEKNCTACGPVAITVIRTATRLRRSKALGHVRFYAVNCVQEPEACATHSVDMVPMLMVCADGIWTPYTGEQTSRAMEEFIAAEIQMDPETHARREKAAKDHIRAVEQRVKEHIDKQGGRESNAPQTATTKRVAKLEDKVARLEKAMKKIQKKKGKETKRKEEL